MKTKSRADALRYAIKTRLTSIRRAIRDRDSRAATLLSRFQVRDARELLTLHPKGDSR